jgi:phage terminase large subunit-like protein
VRFSHSRAARALRFVSNLTHTKGEWAGQPFHPREWQKRPLVKLYGTLNDDGYRQYRTVYVEIPRKNGKSEIAAAIALLMLGGDNEPGAEIYGAASDKDQANLVFDVAAQMVRNDAELSAMFTIKDSEKRIVHKASGSFYRAIAADDGGAHGFNAHAVIIDELHVWTTPRCRKLYDALTTSTGARRQPLVFIITTSGDDKTSICYELHQYALGVRDGQIDDPTFLPVLYCADPDDDWKDEKVWHKVNPALADFRSIDEMRTEFKRAKVMPSRETAFKRLYLCMWTEQATRWLAMDAWRKCKAPETPDLAGATCIGGLDLGVSDDLCAFVRLWLLTDGRRFVKAHFWMPQAAVEKYRTRNAYDIWRKGGWITVTPGDITDFERVQEDVLKLCQESSAKQVRYDKMAAAQMALWLQGKGVRMVDQPQGFFLNESLKNLSDLVVDGKLLHDGNPVMDFCAGNAVVRKGPEERIRLDKDKASDKIDGISALANANAAAITMRPSLYSKGMLILG